MAEKKFLTAQTTSATTGDSTENSWAESTSHDGSRGAAATTPRNGVRRRKSDSGSVRNGVAVRKPDVAASGKRLASENVPEIVNRRRWRRSSQPKIFQTRETSEQLGSLPASTQYLLEPSLYTQNFCCVDNHPPGGAGGPGGSKINFMRNV